MVGRLATVGLFLAVLRHRVPPRQRQGRLRRHPPDRRRDRPAVPRALVLVARQRLVRGRRDGQLLPRLADAARRSPRTASTSARTSRSSSRSRSPRCAGSRRPTSDRRPTDEVLIEFFKKVRPFGPGWRRIREEAGLREDAARTVGDNIPLALLGWFTGCTTIWSALFARRQLPLRPDGVRARLHRGVRDRGHRADPGGEPALAGRRRERLGRRLIGRGPGRPRRAGLRVESSYPDEPRQEDS